MISRNYKLDLQEGIYAVIRYYNGKDYLIAVNSTNLEKNISIAKSQDKSFMKTIK